MQFRTAASKQRRCAYLSEKDDTTISEELDIWFRHPTAGKVIERFHCFISFQLFPCCKTGGMDKVVLYVREVDSGVGVETDVAPHFILLEVKRVSVVAQAHLGDVARSFRLLKFACLYA